MSLKYRDSQGNETPVAGLNGTSGELVPSVALQQSGTVTFEVIGAFENASENVVFQTPMPDTDYEVSFSISNSIFVGLSIDNKTVNGFRVYAYRPVDEATPIAPIVKWTAFKLMTDESRALDETHIEQNTANFAPSFSTLTSYAVGDYVTYNTVLYRCTTAHTAGVWVAGHFTQVTVGGSFTSFPDYAHPISIPSHASTWTATEDCYLQALYVTSDTTVDILSRTITIDGAVAGVVDKTVNMQVAKFSGYIKKGQVVSSTNTGLDLSEFTKAFPLGA